MISNNDQIIHRCASFVKKQMALDSSGHDWWHIYRVWQIAKVIARKEKANTFIVELAALLHDLDDYKLTENKRIAHKNLAKSYLEQSGLDEKTVSVVCQIIRDISFKGAKVRSSVKTKEGEIVQDADRLDAMGAIGIARTFAYGGFKGREIHDPKSKPRYHKTFFAYKRNKSTSINHFYEKLLLLKDLMNTKTGKKLAKRKHALMKDFLKSFYAEFNMRYN